MLETIADINSMTDEAGITEVRGSSCVPRLGFQGIVAEFNEFLRYGWRECSCHTIHILQEG